MVAVADTGGGVVVMNAEKKDNADGCLFFLGGGIFLEVVFFGNIFDLIAQAIEKCG